MQDKSISFEQIKIDMSVSYSQTITDADVKSFAGISGDHNPIHVDDEYASKSRYKKRIAHGLISGSFFSALFGTKLPGPGCVYVQQTFNFKKPVYLGDTVTARIVQPLNLWAGPSVQSPSTKCGGQRKHQDFPNSIDHDCTYLL